MTDKPLRAFIDRIEGEVAVLLLEEDEPASPAARKARDKGRVSRLQIPVRYLPSGVEEGMVVNVSFEIDKEATTLAKKRTAEQIERLQRRRT